jgi:hypothetical protein
MTGVRVDVTAALAIPFSPLALNNTRRKFRALRRSAALRLGLGRAASSKVVILKRKMALYAAVLALAAAGTDALWPTGPAWSCPIYPGEG